MFCTNCGAENTEGSVFCQQCGTRLVMVSPQSAQNPAAQSPQPTNVPTPSGSSLHEGEPSQADKTTQQPISHSTIVLLCCIGVLAALLLIAYFTLRSTIFSPMNSVRSYVDAISNGDYNKATSLVDPGVSNDTRVLLTSAVATAAENRIQNVEVGSLNEDSITHEFTSQVSFTVNGVRQSRTLVVQKVGRSGLLFDQWRVETPMIDEMSVKLPSSMTTFDVNGMNVDISNFDDDNTSSGGDSSNSEDDIVYSDMTTYTLPIYPGVYSVSIPETKYYSSEPIKIDDPQKVAVLAPEPTKALREELLDQINQHVKECTSSQDLNLPDNCSFAEGSFSETAVTDIKRTVIDTPEISKIDMSTGDFHTDTIHTQIAYRHRYSETSDWQDMNTSTSGSITGTFAVEDEKLTVSFTGNK